MPARKSGSPASDAFFEPPPRELVVIADPAAGIVAGPDRIAAAAADVSPIEAALASSGASIAPLFGPTEERVRLATAHAAAAADYAVPNLAVYYRVDAPDDALDDLAQALSAAEGVAGAYVAPPPEPAIELETLKAVARSDEQAPAATPDFVARQIYLGPAPAGFDVQFAWTRPGGTGQNVAIVDIEGAWRFDHEDLLANQGGVVGTPSSDLGWRNHGTATVSVYGGDVNGFGVTGIAPAAHSRGFSVFGGSSPAAAITAAANALNPGDVIVMPMHRPGPDASGAGQDGYIALEWWPADFDAIRYATAVRGVIFVEAAGNGFRNLDAAIFNSPAQGFPAGWTNPFNRANRDSGAIIVGAGAPPPGTHGRDHGPDRSRLAFSNHGACVDVQGWGREVTACGYGELQGGADERLWYTDVYSGTSSASPTIAGVVACIQGVRRAQGQAPYTPAQMRNIFRTTGSPQQDAPGRPATQRIGNRPNLREILGRRTKPLKEKDKLEIKEGKREIKEGKREKLEIKERKNEKNELKELKNEKNEIKEGKREKPEFKELKGEKEGFKLEKNEKLEVDEKVFEVEPFPIRDVVRGGGIEDRVQALESAIGQLAHFIPAELRPDLGMGALADEADYGAYGGAAKTDVEKLAEGY